MKSSAASAEVSNVAAVLHWLNHNQGAVVGLSTGALVLVTAYYAHITNRMMRASERAVRGAELDCVGVRSAMAAMPWTLDVDLVNVGNAQASEITVAAEVAGTPLEPSGEHSEAVIGAAQMRNRQIEGMAQYAHLSRMRSQILGTFQFGIPEDLGAALRRGEAVQVGLTWSWRDGTGRQERNLEAQVVAPKGVK